MRRPITIALAALLATTSPACAASGSETEASQEARDIAASLAVAMQALEAEGFSGFVAIAMHDREPMIVSAGSARPGEEIPYTLDTQFDIGSITKPLTGLAASKLMAEGRLDPDATLSAFFENVPADKASITVHQLLTHMAGFGPGHGADRQPQSREQMLSAVFAEPLNSAPGSRYYYSNTGFSLVAAIIEDITGKSYEAYLVEDVLKPLGIESTGYRMAFDPSRADASDRYGTMDEASWGELDPISWALVGNGGLVSSARDLLNLGQGIAAGGLDPQVANIWLQPRVEEPGGGSDYGFGIVNQELGALGPALWHNGGNPAFQTEWWTFLDSGMTIVVHRNGGPVSIDDAFGPLLGAATGSELGFASPEADTEMAETSELPATPAGALAADFLGVVNENEEAWRGFVETRMFSKLLDLMPVDEHVAQYPMLRDDIGGRSIAAVAEDEEAIRLRLVADGQPPLMLVLFHAEEDGMLKLRGIAVE
ncbi:serine hydrolase domain-containing protein [Sphingomicrobium sediminis]|uniref:Beta-lactamase family protein n=1 Tax=Sphingomicrobium sediminis TaxID=2950949 RepID=A0A9X2EFS4_9SPHN|nr:serine hydrolase domain-containing protein [Sphingomicrobium sediminis]MCM8557163.1 beta-lactamase family protein [Sphingomicrobium sediminis]